MPASTSSSASAKTQSLRSSSPVRVRPISRFIGSVENSMLKPYEPTRKLTIKATMMMMTIF